MEKKRDVLLVILAGAVTGFINGFFGGGGGMIAVPAMLFLMKFRPHKAHATAIFVILPVSILSAALHYSFCLPSPQLSVPVTIGVFIGGIIGAKIMRRISGRTLTAVFCIVMLVAGIKMAI